MTQRLELSRSIIYDTILVGRAASEGVEVPPWGDGKPGDLSSAGM